MSFSTLCITGLLTNPWTDMSHLSYAYKEKIRQGKHQKLNFGEKASE